MIELAENTGSATDDGPRPGSRPGWHRGVAIVDGDQRTPKLLADEMWRANFFQPAGLYHNGESALAWLPAIRPEMILMEMHLPDMSGLGCLRRLIPFLHTNRNKDLR